MKKNSTDGNALYALVIELQTCSHGKFTTFRRSDSDSYFSSSETITWIANTQAVCPSVLVCIQTDSSHFLEQQQPAELLLRPSGYAEQNRCIILFGTFIVSDEKPCEPWESSVLFTPHKAEVRSGGIHRESEFDLTIPPG